MVKDTPAKRRCRRNAFDPWAMKIPLEEEMATHSSSMTWEIPRKEEPGGLYSPWGCRVGYD